MPIVARSMPYIRHGIAWNSHLQRLLARDRWNAALRCTADITRQRSPWRPWRNPRRARIELCWRSDPPLAPAAFQGSAGCASGQGGLNKPQRQRLLR